MRRKDPNKYPPGWNEKRVRKVLRHYERQTEDDAVTEDEAARADDQETVIIVPKRLLPAIRNLVQRSKTGVR